MKKKVTRDSIVVITGASTGIGRATALQFSRARPHLVLIARQIEKLQQVARDCELFGATTEIHSLDVADGEKMTELARDIVRATGRIDVWINNAGVGVVGSFTEVPLEDHRRVIETNVIGTMNGSHAALEVFKRQGSGTLINVASISSRLPTPIIGSYIASKFAIRGLSQSLRQDLAVEGYKDIHVCQVNPSVVDTPAFEHTANYSGRPIKLQFPMATSQQVAQKIANLVEHPRAEVFVGPLSGLGSFAYTWFPSLTAKVVTWGAKRFYLGEGKGNASSKGNLFQPVKDSSSTSGGWKSGETTQA